MDSFLIVPISNCPGGDFGGPGGDFGGPGGGFFSNNSNSGERLYFFIKSTVIRRF